MAKQEIQFGSPPVTETALSLQFSPIDGFNAAHAGCFWQSVLASSIKEWHDAKLVETVAIEDAFEEFSTEPAFVRPVVKFLPAGEPGRVQIIRADDERMIQIQNTRFVYNWRKRGGPYPTYSVVKPEFDRLLGLFDRYLTQMHFPAIQPNQWEITYINHIPKSTLWESVSDWPKVLPDLYIPSAQPSNMVFFETMGGSWRYKLGNDQGRLHVVLQHGRTPEKTQVMALHFTARGPIINNERSMTTDAGFELGHEAIVNTFRQITSVNSRASWQER